jgi:hypothetical protein
MPIDMDSGAAERARIAIVTPEGADARASYSEPGSMSRLNTGIAPEFRRESGAEKLGDGQCIKT